MADHNPAKGVTNLRETRDEHWIPEPEESELFASEAGKTFSGGVLVPWIWFMAYVGSRPGESFHCRWSDMDFDTEQVRVLNSRQTGRVSNKYRIVEMLSELKPVLVSWRKEWEEVFRIYAERYPKKKYPLHDWVFYNPKDREKRASSFTKCFYQAREKAGLPKMTPHALRHYFISYCVMSGINFFTIAKWVGHSSTRMIEAVYGHLTRDFRKLEMGKLDYSLADTATNTLVKERAA